MSTERATPPGEEEEQGLRDRVAAALSALRALGAARLALFREELSQKAAFAGRATVALFFAAALGVGALLLFAAFLTAVFAKLLGSVALGILATLILYAAAGAVAGSYGWRLLKQVEPSDFRATREELSKDWAAVQGSLGLDEDAAGFEGADEVDEKRRQDVEDLQERFRAGSE